MGKISERIQRNSSKKHWSQGLMCCLKDWSISLEKNPEFEFRLDKQFDNPAISIYRSKDAKDYPGNLAGVIQTDDAGYYIDTI